ncbi:MAG: trigger factor [Tissierellia bacterium]|nr:trigger factor [Tissierellia bacterium]
MTELKSHENNIAKFDLNFTAEEFKKAIDTVYKRNRGRIRIDGFRKGKAPKRIIENIYGKDVFTRDAIELLFPKAYNKAIDELNLEVIDQPSVDFDEAVEGKDLTLKVEVETKPHPELGDYSTLEVEKVDDEVKDSDVEAELKRQQEENARMKPVEDRAAKKGDIVNIDFDGSIDGEHFEGGKAEGYDLELGSNTFIPGFEDQIEGKNIGDTFDVNVKFPENYQAVDLKGKDAVFEVKLNSITEKELPELDDEFAKDISEFDTLEELKEDTKKRIGEEIKKQAKRVVENRAIEELIRISDVNAPKAMVEKQIDSEIQNMTNQLQQYGLTLEQYAQMMGGIENLREQFRQQAETRVKADLVVDEVALKEDLKVSDEEIEKEIEDAAKTQGVDDLEKFKEAFRKNISKDFVIENIKRRKAIDVLVNNVKFVEKKEDDKEEKEDK